VRLALVGALVLASATSAAAQPRRGAPAPAPTPVVVPPSPTPVSSARPTPVYESCFGSFVYLTSKDWRECCILCAAGSDSPSEGEIAEATR
jgi:hypothetical protein